MEPMETAVEPLVIRQHERHTCRINAAVSVDDQHADKLVYSRAAADSGRSLPVVAVDISSGGMGIETTAFIPRTSLLKIRVGGEQDGVETCVRVQRVLMTDRTPTYYVGTAFVEQGTAHEQRVAKLMNMAKRK